MKPVPRRVRIADVARAAGVSKTAVSFAFNQPDELSQATTRHILAVAASLGYRPHPVARMLARRRTMSIGVVTPQALATTFHSPFFATFAAGVAEVAETAGYELHFISPDRGSLSRALDRATADGLLVVGLPGPDEAVERLSASDVPLVLVDSTAIPLAPSVRIDDEHGAHAAAAHLFDLGHRDVLVMAIAPMAPYPPTEERGVGPDRLRGYHAAFEERGLVIAPHRLVEAPTTIAGGATAFLDAWTPGDRPTAVLAMSDAIAIGAMSAARALGLRIPGDLSFVGFDDLEIAGYTVPPLTTVEQPIRAKGETAMRMLLAALEGHPTDGPEAVLLPTSLIVRASTGPPPRGGTQ